METSSGRRTGSSCNRYSDVCLVAEDAKLLAAEAGEEELWDLQELLGGGTLEDGSSWTAKQVERPMEIAAG